MKKIIVVLSVLVLIIALAFLVLNSFSTPEKYMNHGKSNAFSDGTSYEGMWLNNELEYIVFIPDSVDVSSQSSQFPGSMKPATEGLTVIPEGLYNNGNLVDPTGLKKTFVRRADGSVKSFEINKELLIYLKLSNIQELETSPAWPKIAEAIKQTIN